MVLYKITMLQLEKYFTCCNLQIVEPKLFIRSFVITRCNYAIIIFFEQLLHNIMVFVKLTKQIPKGSIMRLF